MWKVKSIWLYLFTLTWYNIYLKSRNCDRSCQFFQGWDTKLTRFLPENQHTFKVSFLCQKSSKSFSIFFSSKDIYLEAHFFYWHFFYNINSQITLFSKMMPIFYSSPWHQFSKFNHFLWLCWFWGKNLSNFVLLAIKLDNPYCHNVTPRALPDITSGPDIRQIYKDWTVRKPDFFLPGHRTFRNRKNPKNLRKKIKIKVFQKKFSRFFCLFTSDTKFVSRDLILWE